MDDLVLHPLTGYGPSLELLYGSDDLDGLVGYGETTGLTFTNPTLFTETWTGTNGAAWDSDWTVTYDADGGSSSIQANAGRITGPATNYYIIQASAVTLPTDYEITVDFTTSTAASHAPRIYFGCEFNASPFSGDGHFVYLNPSTDVLGIGTTDNYADSTPVATTTYTWTNTDTIHVRIKVRGTSCKVRVWKNAEDEPLTWQLSGTLSFTYDEMHLAVAGAASVDFDNLYVWTTRPVQKGIDTSWAGSGDLIILRHANPTWTGDVKAIIWKHGGLGGNAEEVDSWTLYPELVADGNGRYVVYAADDGFGGNGAAGNDTEMASIDAVYARAQADYPAFPKVALAGHSLGGMGIVNWAYRNATDVAGMIGVDVILDAAQQDTNDGGTFVTNILNPAYGGNWAANASTRDPEDLATASSALRAIPFEIYDATGDSVLSSNVMSNYVTAHGANATRTTIASGDHGTVHNFIDVEALIADIQTWTFTSSGTTVTPTVVTGAFSVPSPTITVSRTATPATVTAAASVPSPTITATATATTTTVTAAFSVGTQTVTATATVATTTVTGLFEVPAPAVSTGASATATPATVTVAASVPAPTVTATATVTTTTVTGLFSVGAPTLTATANITASTVTAAFTVGTATPSSTATITATTVTAAFQVGTATVLTGTVIPTATVTGAFLVPAPTVTATATITTTTVTGLFSVPAPSVSTASGATVTPTTVTALFAVGTTTQTATATITTTAVVAAFAVGAPTVTAGSGQTITTTTVLAAFSVAAPAISTAVTRTPATVTAPFTVGTTTPAITAGVTGATVTARFLVGAAAVYTVLAQITGRLRTRRADVARTTGRGDTARTTRRSDTPRTTRGDGR